MEDSHQSGLDVSPVFDSLDIDLIIKVLAHTAFSPTFVFFIPLFFLAQGGNSSDTSVYYSCVYVLTICLFRSIRWLSRLYENPGSWFSLPARYDWGEQIVVITGGASGIGELLANTLAVRNVTAVVLDVNPIKTENYNIRYYKCDVSSWEEVEAVSKKIVNEVGEPTVLVNNAGVAQGKLILDLKPEDVQQTFGVNALAHFWTLKAFLPSMIKKKSGHIVTVASVMGFSGAVQMSDYSASKAASKSLHESLRYELDVRYQCPQVRTTLVAPGHVLTPMFRTLRIPPWLLYRFFFPSIPPVTVVKSIITSLHEQHSRTIMVPFYTVFSPCLAVLPSFIKDFAVWVAQANYAMVKFEKVTGKRHDEISTPLGGNKPKSSDQFVS